MKIKETAGYFYWIILLVLLLLLFIRSALYGKRIWQESALPIYSFPVVKIKRSTCNFASNSLSFDEQVMREYYLLDNSCEK